MDETSQIVVLQAQSNAPSLLETAPLWASAAAALLAVFVALYVHHDSKKPHVVASLSVDRDTMNLLFIVQNVGTSEAYDVEIDGLADYLKGKNTGIVEEFIDKGFIRRGIPVLAPGDIRMTTIAVLRSGAWDVADESFDVGISYLRRGFRRKPTVCVVDSFELDFYSFFNAELEKSAAGKAADQLSGMRKDDMYRRLFDTAHGRL